MRSPARHRRPRRPAAITEPPRFTIGRDHHGWWVVEDRLGRVGGLFANEDAAMHYALEESSRDRRAVRSQPRGASLELLIEMFGTGEALGWLTDNLRRELFAQGRVGNGERSTAERLLSSEELDGVVAVMIKRHEGLSGTNVFAVSNPIALLFNWLDLGDGEGPRRLIGENVVSDIGLVEKLEALRSTITTSDEGSV